MIKKKNKEITHFEFEVDSRYSSKKEQKADGKTLMEARLDRMKNLSKDQVVRAKLLQSKLKKNLFFNENLKNSTK